MPNPYATLAVLVVDDHPFQRAAAELLLQRLGVTDVRCAADGREAVDLLATLPFDLVLCDIDMPRLNGPQLMSELSRRGAQAFAGRAPAWSWMSAVDEGILASHADLAGAIGLPRVHALRKPLCAESLDGILQDAVALRSQDASGAPPELPDDRQLLDALRTRSGFFILLQPQVRIDTGTLAGAEALCRWQHPDFGLVPPDHFIARLEALGETDAIFSLVTERCLAVQARLQAGGASVPLSINASAQTLCSSGMLERFDAQVAASGIPRGLLTVELTETFPVHDAVTLSVALNRLRLMGYGVAMDDFGVGITTLKLLADLPFTQIKLDRSFVGNVDGNSQRALICRSMIALARELNLECVAEGVETEAQREALLALGCPVGQGYLWSRPLSEDAFVGDVLSRR
ncbi:diguanylate phosphodiesterase [Cupriavidus sp. USMAA2-4]|uniref:Diguanylate phosphodiesterase n=1 Tax=Cupriavidus malaysiensis TaxID=367825 RepID=A0A1D9I2J3_9BURK|nr:MULTISPECIES: EAL domain-containing protein [Cupriavidus]AOY90672.1 diguanylate phosphodiesterase [Cupriavidus sp. USMAA2-4]AOY99703.1 diguanylate phosphodiesterase [Cupriavidus sp. USMAHM13]AOZ06326.1 diguanylate phosphodiesterase [Cupriavidus malaysiensis]